MDMILLAAGLIVEIGAAAGVIWKMLSWVKKIAEGEKCQLRSTMLRTYYAHQEEKKVRQYEYENFVKSYEAYKALNGNSFIDRIYEEVAEWHIIT